MKIVKHKFSIIGDNADDVEQGSAISSGQGTDSIASTNNQSTSSASIRSTTNIGNSSDHGISLPKDTCSLMMELSARTIFSSTWWTGFVVVFALQITFYILLCKEMCTPKEDDENEEDCGEKKETRRMKRRMLVALWVVHSKARRHRVWHLVLLVMKHWLCLPPAEWPRRVNPMFVWAFEKTRFSLSSHHWRCCVITFLNIFPS